MNTHFNRTALLFGFILLLVFAVTALSLGLAFALPGHIELIAVIFVANLPLLFASTALAPLAFMPGWLGWLAALNPLTFAIEPIRAAYAGSFHLSDVVLSAPYGDLTATACLGILAALAAAAKGEEARFGPGELPQVDFGEPILVIELELCDKRKLAREDVEKVMANLRGQGFHLQMPPKLQPELYHGNQD